MRIAVVSPSVDRFHGTERAVSELLRRLAYQEQDIVDLFSQRVTDIRLSENSDSGTLPGLFWHRVPALPGPHVLGFLAWLLLNRWQRFRRSWGSQFRPDVVFSPGVNAFDADVIQVHAMFHRLSELQSGSDRRGFRGLHRRLYYALVCMLERRIYRNSKLILAAVSGHTARQLDRYIGRKDAIVIPYGVDHEWFSPEAIASLRDPAREVYGWHPDQTTVLLVGNDWRNKGLPALLEAVARCPDLKLRLFVVGHDEQSVMRRKADQLSVAGQVKFFSLVKDVRVFYAVADIIAAPSLEDSFNLPVLEAMSCGLPAIVSPHAGISEWLSDGRDCLLLKNPEHADELAAAIRVLVTEPARRTEIARNALSTAAKFTWDSHAAELRKLLVKAADAKRARGRD